MKNILARFIEFTNMLEEINELQKEITEWKKEKNS